MSESMTVEEAIQHAREWQQQGLTFYPGANGFRVVCTALADEVERLRSELASVTEANSEYHRDALALEQERDELRRRVEELEDELEDAKYEAIEAMDRSDHE